MNKKVKKACSIGLVVAAVLGGGYVVTDELLEDDPTVQTVRSTYGNHLRFSPFAIEEIALAEGCREDSYYCPANKLTVGVGSTKDVQDRMYSIEEIANRYAEDLMDAQNCLEKNVEAKTGKELPQSVFDAFGDLVFNVGCRKFINYPMYTQLINGDYINACNRLNLYVNANGKPLPGLVKRRKLFVDNCINNLKEG